MWTCNQGLLASRPLSLEQMRATGLRVLQDGTEALARILAPTAADEDGEKA